MGDKMNDHTSDDAIDILNKRISGMVLRGPLGYEEDQIDAYAKDLNLNSMAAIALVLIKAVNHAIEVDKRFDDRPDSETLG